MIKTQKNKLPLHFPAPGNTPSYAPWDYVDARRCAFVVARVVARYMLKLRAPSRATRRGIASYNFTLV